MPKLPKLTPPARIAKSHVTPAEEAKRIAEYLLHMGAKENGPKSAYSFARRVRHWMDEDEEAKAAFVKWYEKQ